MHISKSYVGKYLGCMAAQRFYHCQHIQMHSHFRLSRLSIVMQGVQRVREIQRPVRGLVLGSLRMGQNNCLLRDEGGMKVLRDDHPIQPGNSTLSRMAGSFNGLHR